ncbi:hypothetical protein [Paraburkholderia humisilvae]|uniref:hypothetical protein n=1 Tax=Paraburkholderia humisilvae TaxID=627669 RepID=UPI001582590E
MRTWLAHGLAGDLRYHAGRERGLTRTPEPQRDAERFPDALGAQPEMHAVLHWLTDVRSRAGFSIAVGA